GWTASPTPAPPIDDADDAMAIKEAADLAGVSDDTVRRWAEKHGIGRRLFGAGPWIISRAALLDQLAVRAAARALRAAGPGGAAVLGPAHDRRRRGGPERRRRG